LAEIDEAHVSLVYWLQTAVQ